MGNPRFLDSTLYPFRWIAPSIPANTSSAITTNVVAELLALTPPWVSEGGGVYRSPANSTGRFMRITITEPVGSRWNMAVSDDSGFVVCSRGITIDSVAPTTVQIYTGKAHIFLDSAYSTTSYVYAFLMDSFPDEERYYAHPVVGTGTRSSTGTADGLGNFGTCFAIDNLATAATSRYRVFNYLVGGSSKVGYPIMASGRYLYDGVWVAQNIGGTTYWSGKFIQCLCGTAQAAAYSDWIVPIDYSTSATFRATSLVDGPIYNRLYMRKA